MSSVVLTQYAIYDHPRDYPNHYVVRRWDIVEGCPVPVPDQNMKVAGSLDVARLMLPAGLIWLVADVSGLLGMSQFKQRLVNAGERIHAR